MSTKAGILIAIASPFCRKPEGSAPGIIRDAISGLAPIRLTKHSNIRDKLDPFAPPRGISIEAQFGSFVMFPFLSMAHPSGIGSPASRASKIFPIDTVEVDISTTKGGCVPPGTAIASGLVDKPATLAP